MAQSVERISLQTNDFDALCEAASGWDQQYMQMSPGRFKGGLELTQIGSTQIMRERWTRKIRFQGVAPTGGFGFGLPLEIKGSGSLMGSVVDLDTVIMVAPDKAGDFIAPEYWDSVVLGIPQEMVMSIGSVLSDEDTFDFESHGCVSLRPAVAASLRTLGSAFLARSKAATAKEDDALVVRWSEQFVKVFVWEILNAQQGEDGTSAPAKAARLVQRATDFALADPAKCIGMTEICDELDVGLRTLHNAFKHTTGVSPAAWLRRWRLNQARKALLDSSPDDTLVKQVALDHGFLNFNHFSGQYREHFGDLPSETLQMS